MWVRIIRQIWRALKKWLWSKPTEEVPQKRVRLKAEEVLHAWTIVTYKGQKIPIRKSELTAWNNLPPKERKKMAMKLDKAKRKRQCKAVEIDGQKVLIKNR